MDTLTVPWPKVPFNQVSEFEIMASTFDVDNTLVSDNSPELPSPAFLEEVTRVTALKRHVGTISARGAGKLKDSIIAPVVEAAGTSGREYARYFAMANGAIMYDALQDKVIHRITIPSRTMRDIGLELQELGLHHWVNDGGEDKIWQHQKLISTSGNDLGTYAAKRDEWLPDIGSNRKAILSYVPKEPLVIVAEGVNDEDFEKLSELTTSYSTEGSELSLLDYHVDHLDDGTSLHKAFILPRDSNKRFVIQLLSDLNGVELENTMVCGDGNNDEPMLSVVREYGGLSVAMGNAGDKALAAATHITLHQKEDGAAVALRSTILAA